MTYVGEAAAGDGAFDTGLSGQRDAARVGALQRGLRPYRHHLRHRLRLGTPQDRQTHGRLLTLQSG